MTNQGLRSCNNRPATGHRDPRTFSNIVTVATCGQDSCSLLNGEHAGRAPDRPMQDEPQPDQPSSIQHADPKPSSDSDKAVIDPRLDLTSPEFDAQLALQTPDVQLPVPDAPVLDNVSKFTKIVQYAEEPQQQDEANQQADPDAAREAQAKKAKAAALKQRALQAAKRAETSVKIGTLPAIMSAAAVGPLAVLAQWQSAAQRIYVVTRHASGVRGRAVGTLVAFDKYLNLLLRDVEEAYTVIVKVQRVKQQVVQQPSLPQPQDTAKQEKGQQQQQQQQPPGQQQQRQAQQQQQPQQQQEHQEQQPQARSVRTRTRWCRKQQHRYRQLDQILLRGDNIVLVSGSPPSLGLQPSGISPANAQAL